MYVCLFAGLSKNQQIFTKFGGKVAHEPRKNHEMLVVRSLDLDPDLGILTEFLPLWATAILRAGGLCLMNSTYMHARPAAIIYYLLNDAKYTHERR